MKEVLNEWYVVCKSEGDFDLSLWMPFSWIINLQNKGFKVEPLFIGVINGRKVILDKIEKFSESECFIVSNGEQINLGDMHKDMKNMQEHIIKGIPVVYDWRIDENLMITGVMYKNGRLRTFKDEVVSQDDEHTLNLKKNNIVYMAWNSISVEQINYFHILPEEYRTKLCPKGYGHIKNCVLDLTILLINKKERDKKIEALSNMLSPFYL